MNDVDGSGFYIKADAPPSGPYLMISGHDYRSKRQVNVHFIMRELEKLGKARFFSIGYSSISLMKHDPRSSLWPHSNLVQSFNGIECYLWRTLLHPFNLHYKSLAPLESETFKLYASMVPSQLKQWIAEASTIILESGLAIILFDLIKKINSRATVIYLCSDALSTIGCASFLSKELARAEPQFDAIIVPSPKLVSEFTLADSIFYVPHGMDPVFHTNISPYEGGSNLVSVGSMLFDRTLFEIAAAEFPEFTFHVIGGGKSAAALSAPNIRVYEEMPFKETIGYIEHANAGIAPYRGEDVAPYLADTSMKLMQFEAYGLPAVCPDQAKGMHAGRFGYEPGNSKSIAAAIRAALAYGRFPGIIPLSWAEVAARILSPRNYPDTLLSNVANL